MASSNSTANRDWGKVMVPVTTFLTEPGKAHNFSPAIILQLLSMFHNLMDACWGHNEVIEMHVCELSRGLDKVKCDKIMSSYGCTCEVVKYWRS